MKDILQQTLAQLRSQRLLTVLSITGSALSIFLIMVVVIMQEVKVMPFAPESNRERFLHASNGSILALEHEDLQSNGGMSYKSTYALYGKLKTPESVSIYSNSTAVSSVNVAGQQSVSADIKETDANFWKVFDFSFISGKPYTQADFESEIPVAVLGEGLARKLFGTADAAGRDVLINYAPYRVAGVVKDVSTLADKAYAQAWIPILLSDEGTWCNGLMGGKAVTILAKSRGDFDAIHEEAKELMRAYNKEIEPTGWRFVSRGRPYSQEKSAVGEWANVEPDEDAARRQHMLVYLILLIVPAINLSGMTDSRLRRRVSEIGVRRAFGCTRAELFGQLLGENMIITACAGIIGWLLSVVFALLCDGLLFGDGSLDGGVRPTVEIGMLVRPGIFLTALLFCFILNMLSSSLPSWRASRSNIVNALNKH